ncbi:MAG: type II secretion system secretin GspD [Polyangiaceae bacterium]|nr:type II secretion system secretin GspD [Polyangiaceae bacterium]
MKTSSIHQGSSLLPELARRVRVLSNQRRRRRIWVSALLVCLSASSAFAQRRNPGTPPGDAGDLPSSMRDIEGAVNAVEYRPKPGGYKVRFNLKDADLAELVNHISGMTGKRFIYGAKVRSIKATVVSPEPVTLQEAYQAFLSILDVNGLTVIPHGRFLKIVDSAGVAAQGTPIYSRGGAIPNTDTFITRIYRTRYVGADEASALLAKFKSKEGDISTYPAGNLLIITATGTQIRRMVRILEEVDVGGAGQQMWIEPINHGNADEMAKRLTDLFEVGQGGGGGLSKIIADEQTNSLILVGTDDSYTKLLQVLKKLDSRPGEAGRIHVLPLQHAVADELSKTLQQMLTGQSRGKKKSSGGGNAGGMFEGDVNVTADQATNSLVVTSSPRDFAQQRIVVDRLDQPRRQVFIEAVIMDVGVNDSNELGFSWHGGAQPSVGGDQATLLGGFNAGKSVGFPADPSALQGFAAGIRGPDLQGTSNLLGTGLSIPAFGVVVNALASSGRGNVLATPHIIATDNVTAEINVGENIPLQTNVGGGLGALGAAGAAGSVAAGALAAQSGFGFNAPREDVGNKIKVTPHINESDQVRLEIEQESSAAGTPEGNLGVVPITKRTANTTVVVKDQQTIVIGGLMNDQRIVSKDKVPILGDIPVLGFLFSSTTERTRKSNLLLILTPHVIREQSDLRRIFERKMQERQEFLDRYFIFASEQWSPPTDYSRANGLVEDIRQAYFQVLEKQRLEEELRPREVHEHVPGEPIDLPANLKSTNSSKGRSKSRSAPKKRPAPKKKKKAPAKKRRGSVVSPASALQRHAANDEEPSASFDSTMARTLRVAPPRRSISGRLD